MSAFVVSRHHLDRIISAALTYGLPSVACENASEVGRVLWSENVRSVAHRYPGDREDIREAARAAESYIYRSTRAPTLAETAKLLDCLQYQSCECDDYETSRAAMLTLTIRHGLLRSLPGYEEAPWAVD